MRRILAVLLFATVPGNVIVASEPVRPRLVSIALAEPSGYYCYYDEKPSVLDGYETFRLLGQLELAPITEVKISSRDSRELKIEYRARLDVVRITTLERKNLRVVFALVLMEKERMTPALQAKLEKFFKDWTQFGSEATVQFEYAPIVQEESRRWVVTVTVQPT